MRKLAVLFLFVPILLIGQNPIVIFNTELKATTYSDSVHQWLLENRPNYNAARWSDTAVVSAGNDMFWIQAPVENPSIPERTQSQAISRNMPDIGQVCKKDTFYLYSGDIWKCRQTHNRTIYHPQNTPALFSCYRDNSGNLQWITNEQVEVGWMRIYNGTKYEVLQAHQTQESWAPPLTIGVLWKVWVDPLLVNEWQPGVSYAKNSQCTYQGHTYKCLQAHTSQVGWQPPNVPALWQLLN